MEDPYGVYPDRWNWAIAKDCFARSPGSSVWVWFGDLPPKVMRALERRQSKLALGSSEWGIPY
jgi:hypothetical protein